MDSSPKFDCVISRYREYIDWVNYLLPEIENIYIYNKGDNDVLFKEPGKITCADKLKKKNIENLGRIDHTIVYHILEHWDSLPDYLIVLPGTILMSPRKGHYFSYMMKTIKKKLLQKYKGFFAPRFKKVSPDFNYTIDDYQAEGYCNRNSNKFIKSEYKDFQTWKNALIDDKPIKYVAMRGMFIVSRENIKHIDKEVYQKLLVSLSVGDNIENGHFAERIWAHLFTQLTY